MVAKTNVTNWDRGDLGTVLMGLIFIPTGKGISCQTRSGWNRICRGVSELAPLTKLKNMNEVRAYYNEHVLEEDKRLEKNVFELPVTFKYIDKYIHAGDRVLDISCGTGKYAEMLLERGCLLGLNDLSEKNMSLTLDRLGHREGILHTDVSDALYSGIWNREQWDAILILGPLYHMSERSERLNLLRKAKESVRPGGTIFLAFMSRTAALLYGIRNNPAGITRTWGALQFWYTGTDDEFIEDTKWFVNAYFSFPEEIDPLVTEAGLEPMHLAGIEGIFGEHMKLFQRMDPDLQKHWMDFAISQREEPHMIQVSKHLLSVCRRPE